MFKLNLSSFRIRRAWWLSALTRLATVALLAVPMLGLMLASHTQLVQAAGVLTITDLTAPNVIGDSNIESKAGEGPEVFTIGAKFCNTGDDTLKDVFAYIGNGTTPGTFPTTTKTAPPYGGTFALQLLDADKSDATRYLGDLAPSECVVVYWQVKYPVVDANGKAVWGLQASIADDLDLHWSVWGKGVDAGTSATVTGSYSDTIWVRNEITAAANKIQPTPGGYTTIDPSTAVAPGQLVIVCYHNVKFGNVNQGFDVDGIPGPDYDLWFQPIGETFWNPDALRLVRIEAELKGTNCGGGKPDVTLTPIDTTYFSRLDQYGGCLWQGTYCYKFLALGTGSGTVTPYQEAASGSNNEKYNADYGGDDIAVCDNCITVTSSGTSVVLDKTVDKPTATDGDTLTYNIAYTNNTSTPLGDPDTGNSVVIEDSIPAHTTYVAGSATCSAGCTILYSTNGGVTWSSTAPADPTTVTDLRWVLNAAVPAHGSGTVGFQVLINTGFSGTVTNMAKVKVDGGPTLDSDDAITCVNCTPQVQAFKTDSLFLDADGDGVPSPGDRLKYTIIIINNGSATATGVVFTDNPDPNTRLIVGSVDLSLCPGCSVTSGNNTGDMSVGVNVGNLAPGASVEIGFRVSIGTDGFTQVANQGTVQGTNFTAKPTDDPDTTTPNDPTVTPVTIGPPELTITKFGPAEAVIGTTITYTGTLTNISDSTAYNVVLVDQLPNGVTFIGSSHTAVYDPVANTVTWNLGTVPAGASIPGWLTVKISSTVPDNTVLTDTFSLTWKDKDGNALGPATASRNTTVHTHPQLTLTKEGPAEASPEETFSYKLTIRNLGGMAAENVILTDTLPGDVSYVSSNPSGSHTAGVVTWNLGTIAAGGSRTIAVTVKVNAGIASETMLINTASVTWDGADQPVEATWETTVYTQAELVITKFGPQEAAVDSTITYTGTLSNIGGTIAKGVVLVDYLPNGVTFVGSSHTAVYDPVANTVTWNLGDIPPGASIPGWLTVHIDPTVADNTILHNTFYVIWKDADGNPSGSDTATWDTTVHTHPQLTVEKTGPQQASPGETINYTIKVENIGGTDALNVTLQDILPTGLTYQSSNPSGSHAGGVVTWNLGTIAAYGSKQVSLVVKVNDIVENNTPLINTASVTWKDSLAQNYGPATDTHQTTIYTQPELVITKFGPAEAAVDSTITYIGTLSNLGGTVAKNVILVDYLPTGVTFVSSSHAATYNPVANTVTWNLGDIPPGTSIPGWLTVHIDASVADNTVLHDIFSVIWEDTDGNDYGPAEAGADTTVHTHPQLTVEKTGPQQASPGETINYTIKVENIGGTDALNVTLQDILPTGLTYVSSNPSGSHAGGVVTWNLGTIAAYGSKQISLVVKVNDTVENNTPLINTASVTWKDSQAQNYGPATDTWQTTVYTQPQLTINKSGPARAYPGETLSYAIEVCNVGGAPAIGTALTDNLPTGLNYINSSHGGSHAAGVVTWNLGTLDPGDCVQVTLTVRVDAGVPNGTPLEDIASVSWSDSDGKDYGPASDIWETLVNTHPQLTPVKTSPTEARQGDQITYKIEVCNTSGAEARNVTLYDFLPIGLTYVSSNPSGTHVNGVITWNLGTIARDACKSVFVTVTVDFGLPVGATLIDIAIVTWKDPDGKDYGPTTDTVETVIEAPPPTPIGGVTIPINKLALLSSWIGLATLASIAFLAIVAVRKRKA